MADEKERITFSVPAGEEDLLEDLDEFIESHGYESRTEAIIDAIDILTYRHHISECYQAIEESDPESYLESAENVYRRDRQVGDLLAETYIDLEEIGFW